MPFLTCTNLTVGYGRQPVAEHISFSVDGGDLLCIIGSNGAGKSTLLKTLLGIIAPLSGQLALGDGLDARDVGYLPQLGELQRGFPASVWEVVLSGRLARIGRRPFYRSADKAAARQALERMGIAALRDRSFQDLSGGQRQRVLMARALCAAARLIVLDEPTTGLDPDATASLYQTLDDLRREGLGLIVVSHDLDEALAHATHVLSLEGAAPEHLTIDQWRRGREVSHA